MITYDMVCGINSFVCDQDMNESVVINQDNILSALSVQQWYDDSEMLASALLRSLCIGHGFRDGNKRTAAIIANYVCEFKCSDSCAEKIILNIAKGELGGIMNLENIANKIYKLFELADKSRNNSEDEAYAALLKAQELLTKYNLTMEDISTPKENIVDNICEHKYNYGFRYKLANIIAKNFRTRTFIRSNTVVFYGYRSDVEASKAAFEFAYKTIVRNGEKLRNQIYAESGYSAGVFNSYASGFLSGMSSALDKQCEALQIVVPVEVSDSFEEMSQNWAKARRGMRNTPHYDSAYRSGFHDAKHEYARKELKR